MSNKYNFLMVEDNEGDAIIYRSLIERNFAYEVEIEVVKSLGSAVSEINADYNFYDLVFLDLNLGDSFGISTVITFREYCKNIPIIVVTSESDQDIINKAIFNGADSFLIKGKDDAITIMDEIYHVLENFKFKNNLSV